MSGEHASRQLIDDYARGDATMAADDGMGVGGPSGDLRVVPDHLAACVATGRPASPRSSTPSGPVWNRSWTRPSGRPRGDTARGGSLPG